MLSILILAVGMLALAACGVRAASRAAGSPGRTSGAFSSAERLSERVAGRLGPQVGYAVTVAAGVVGLVLFLWPLGRLFYYCTFIDHPTFDFFHSHIDTVPSWTHLMGYVTNIGNTVNSRAIGIGGAVVLALVAQRRRWVPPTVMGTALLLEHFLRNLLSSIVHRGHPPTAGGTFPSGGCSRIIVVYGLLAFLAISARGQRPSRRLVIGSTTLIALLAYVEGYSRVQLDKHWVTDVVGGWIYGLLLLGIMMVAAKVLDSSLRRTPEPAELPTQHRSPAQDLVRPAVGPHSGEAASAVWTGSRRRR